MTITHARLSIHLQVQPRWYRSASPQAEEEMRRHNDRLLAALRLPFPLRPGTVNELQPRQLPMSAEAQAVWVEFFNAVEKELAPDGILEPIIGFAAKMAEHAARIVAVLAWWANHDARDIDAETMCNAIQIVEWYGKEALRLHNSGRIPQETAEAEKLRQWLVQKWLKPNISIPDICRLGPSSVRVAVDAKRLVKVLVDHGWLVPIPGGAVIDGGRRREAWAIQR